MAQKSLNAKVVLGGQTTSGFNALANKVEHLGQIVGQVSDKIIDVGEESVQIYKDYETNMAGTRNIYEQSLGSVNQAARAMDVLEKKTQEWAASTIFHTDDVSQAVYNAAQAGWTWEEQLEGMPRAMLLAQAGQLDLQDGLSYLARALNVTNTEFSDSGRFVDQWVKASALANLTIEDLGQSMSTMGMTATFAGGTAQLLSMLDVLADTGTVGSQAGTQLRSMMLRVVAPTKKASEAFEMLGADAEELEEILEDEALVNASKRLEEMGFSAYDEKGNLKDFLTILTDMDAAMAGMIDKERNATLKDIFPTRSFATALALINAVKGGKLPELYDAIYNSEGAAQSRSDALMNTLYGDIELLGSKREELERKFGGILSDQVSGVAGALGSIIDKLNELPEERLSALVGGLEGIALLGAGASFGGAVLKFFGALGWQGATIMLAAGAIGAIVGYLNELDDQNFKSHFGSIELEVTDLMDTMAGIRTPFDESKTAISQWEEAVTKAQAAYTEMTGALSAETLQAALSGKTLSQGEIETLQGYGKEIGKNVLQGIGQAKQRDLTFFDAIFGDTSTQKETDAYVMSMDVVNSWYSDLQDDAFNIGQKLREQMTAALADQTLDAQEREAIQATVNRLNEIQRRITNQANQEDYYSELYRAQNVSWDSMADYAQKTQEKYTQAQQAVEDIYAQEYGILMAAFDNAIETGKEFEWNGRTRKATETDRALALAELERQKQEALTGETAKYGSFMETAMRTAIATGWGDALNVIDAVRGQAKERDENGNLTFEDVDWADLAGKFGEKGIDSLTDLQQNSGRIKQAFESFRDFPGVGEMLDYLDNAYGLAIKLNSTDMAWQSFQQSGGTYDPMNLFSTEAMRAANQRYLDLQKEIEATQSRIAQAQNRINQANADIENRSGKYYSALDYLFGTPSSDERQIAQDMAQIESAEAEMQEAQAQLAMLQAEFAAFDGEIPVTMPDGKTLAVNFNREVQENLGSVTLDVYLNKIGDLDSGKEMAGFAEGGRATEASIFGEVPGQAEWAIPEEHSLRTASLLDQTRQASGFTWGELDALSGGGRKNDAAKSVEIHITYSPHVQAQDARGVDAVLKADKERMEKMIRQVLEDVKTEERAASYT